MPLVSDDAICPASVGSACCHSSPDPPCPTATSSLNLTCLLPGWLGLRAIDARYAVRELGCGAHRALHWLAGHRADAEPEEVGVGEASVAGPGRCLRCRCCTEMYAHHPHPSVLSHAHLKVRSSRQCKMQVTGCQLHSSVGLPSFCNKLHNCCIACAVCGQVTDVCLGFGDYGIHAALGYSDRTRRSALACASVAKSQQHMSQERLE